MKNQLFRTDVTAEKLQRMIKEEWHICFSLYTKGYDYITFSDEALREKTLERAFTFGRGIGQMLSDDSWNEVFTDDFNKMWAEVRDAFFIPRTEICESEMLMRGISEETIYLLENGIE